MNQPDIQIENPASPSLVGFITMDDGSLETTRKTLGLTLSPAEFRACRNYYRDTVRKDPQIEDLFLLNGLVSSLCHAPNHLLITEMKTESDLIAEIFSDLMARRRAIGAASDRPAALAELANIINTYLSVGRAKAPSVPHIKASFSSHRDLTLVCDGFRLTASTGNQPTDISIGTKNTVSDTAAIKNGDYVFALVDTHRADSDFEAKITDFLSQETVIRACKKAIPLIESGILQGLLQVADGLTVNATALLNENDAICHLTDPTLGVLLVASPQSSADMLLMASGLGLRFIHAATVISGKLIRIPQKDRVLSFRSDFLRTLTLPRAYSVAVSTPSSNGAEVELSRIGTCTLEGKKHSVVKVDALGTDTFFSSLNSALYAVLHCVAAGVEIRDIQLFSHLNIPRLSSPGMGEALSAILALYRVQAELELWGNNPSLEAEGDGHIILSIVATAPLPETVLPSAAVGGGTKIFYLEPLYSDNGLIDFESVKNMLSYIHRLVRDGHVRSMMPSSNDLLADLTRMSRNTTVEYLHDQVIPSRLGGMLIESDAPVEGILVAATEHPCPSPEADANEDSIPVESPSEE